MENHDRDRFARLHDGRLRRRRRPAKRQVRLEEVAQRIETLNHEIAALDMLGDLLRRQVDDRYRMGALLKKIRDERWFGGFPSFEDLVARRFGMRKSKAYAAIRVYWTLRTLSVPWEQVKDLGVAKLTLICARTAAEGFDHAKFSTRVEAARVMTLRQLERSLGLRRPGPPYVFVASESPEEEAERMIETMRQYPPEHVIGWLHEAHPEWRPRLLGPIWRRFKERKEAALERLRARHAQRYAERRAQEASLLYRKRANVPPAQ